MMKSFYTKILLALATVSVSAAPAVSNARSQLPLVQSTTLRGALTQAALLNHANKLQGLAYGTPERNRVAGKVGHNKTVEYIYNSLVATGYYNVELQEFTYVFSDGNVTLSAGGSPYFSEYIEYVPAGTVAAPLIPVKLGCAASDFPSTVRGNIALVPRGSCDYGLKVALAGASGAAGIIIYNNAPGLIGPASLNVASRPEGKYIPTGSISQEDGLELLAKINGGTKVTANLEVDAIVETRYTNNVLATSKGGDQNNIILAGGHTDSVAAGPGINDNGSGAMGVLEIALKLTSFSVKNAVRFGFWSAEEFGNLGSAHYVSTASNQELLKITLYLNFDTIASPNFGYFIYDGDGSAFNNAGPAGSAQIEHLFEDYFKSVGLKSAPTALDGSSDYDAFMAVNIPGGGLFAGADGKKTAQEAKWWGGKAGVAYDINYHSAGDDVKNLNVGAWVQNTKAAAHAIATYALSTAGIPLGTQKKKRTSTSNKPRAGFGEATSPAAI